MHPLARPQSENLDWQPTHAQLTHAVVAHQIGRWGAYHLRQAVQPRVNCSSIRACTWRRFSPA